MLTVVAVSAGADALAGPPPTGGCNILLPAGEGLATFDAVPWPNGVIPFDFDANVSVQNQLRTVGAMQEIERVSDVQFVFRNPAVHSDFIHVRAANENSSFVGVIGGSQDVNIVSWSVPFIIVHELLHAAGFWHEHQRPDRNQFVQIDLNWVPVNRRHNFDLRPNALTVGPYDFDSVMHYGQWAWSTAPHQPGFETIVALPPNQIWQQHMGQTTHLSQGDIDGLCAVYGCRPGHDECTGALPLQLGVNPVDNRWSTDSTPPGCSDESDVWYSFVAPCSGQIRLDVVNAHPGYSPTVGVYDACPPAAELACAVGPPASVTINATANSTYLIRVGGVGGSTGAARLVINCAPPTCFQGFVWSQAATTGPAARYDHAMVYDSARQRLVLFGGRNTSSYFSDTWEWDAASSTWTMVAAPGPTARYGHAMAYDSARQRVVLFGGRDAGGFRDDTWEFDGLTGTWAPFTVAAPDPRQYHGMAYDAARAETVLFGGFGNAPPFADTWVWNGTFWDQRVVAGPAARFNFGMAYDSGLAVTVLFAGADNSSTFGDTWAWNGTAWSRVATSGPPGRISHELAYDAGLARTVLLGGYGTGGAGVLDDTWTGSWNGPAWVWTPHAAVGSGRRFGYAAAYDAGSGAVVVHAGAGEASLFADTILGAPGVPNDDSLGAITVTSGSSRAVDLRCAADGPAGCADRADLWFRYVAPCTGRATVSVTGATFVPELAAYESVSSPPIACVAGVGSTAVASFPVTANIPYLVRVGAAGGAGGTGTFHVAPCDAQSCPPQMGFFSDQTSRLYYIVGGSSGPGWSWCISWLGGFACDYNVQGVAPGGTAADVAHRFVESINNHSCANNRLSATQLPPPRDHEFTVTIGGNQVFLNLCVGPAGQQPGCCFNPYTLCPFNPDAREIVLSGVDCNANDIDDTIDLHMGAATDLNENGILDVCEAPPNDQCTGAITIAGDGTFPFDNSTAATDGPAHAACLFRESDQIAGDLWYRWIPAASGTATLSTCAQTSVDTKVAVYLEESSLVCPPLLLLACDDDACASPQTRVSWTVATGQPYYIRLGNFVGAPGGAGTFTISTDSCPADWNADGIVDSADFFDFLAAFFAETPSADFNHDGRTNSQDFFDFLAAFFAGCSL